MVTKPQNAGQRTNEDPLADDRRYNAVVAASEREDHQRTLEDYKSLASRFDALQKAYIELQAENDYLKAQLATLQRPTETKLRI